MAASALAFYGCKKTDSDTGIDVNATMLRLVAILPAMAAQW